MGDGAAGRSVTFFQTCLAHGNREMAFRVSILKARPHHIDLTHDRQSLQRQKVRHHGRNEFRNRRVDVHRPLQDRGRCLGIHGVENAMNDFIA